MAHQGRRDTQHVLITGGAGFIGVNLAANLLARTDARVAIFDNLSRPGVELNLAWLKTLSGAGRLRFIRGDVRDAQRVRDAARNACEIHHLAVTAPPPGVAADLQTEYDVNVNGTLNVLEAALHAPARPPVLFTSTSKIYGSLPAIPLVEEPTRLRAADPHFRGVNESTPLDAHVPPNTTMTAADEHVAQFVRDYGLPAVTLRLGSVAGPNQFGNEGQGWVAHFIYSALSGRPVSVFGDGLQVRDVLHVSDVVEAIIAARAYLGTVSGKSFNIGGGMERSVSVREMLALIQRLCHVPVHTTQQPARPFDQLLYISDNSLFTRYTGWLPRRTLEQTVRDISAFWHAYRTHGYVPARPRRSPLRRAA